VKYEPKKYYIKTYGCQANVADSNSMSGILEALGFEQIKSGKKYKNENKELLDILPKTDLFIINSCSVRQKSEDKVYGLGKVISELKKANKKLPFTILSGCMVGSVTGKRQRYEFSELKKKTPWVGLYMNPDQVFDLPKLLKKAGVLDEWALKKFDPKEVETPQQEKEHAYVNVSFGCDNFCAFCVVPYARETEVSRSEKEILAEVRNLARRGYRHITLCGQNVNSWGLDIKERFEVRTGSKQELPFTDVLRKVCDVEGVEEIDFISSNPFDFTQDLIDTLVHPKISNYLHIAVQSGNNEILEKMNRRHTAEEFIDLMDRIRKVKPEAELGTDIIVGFPGETREQFMDTVELFKKVTFSVAFISMYSPRKGTPAEKFLEDDVSLEEKKWRHEFLTRVWKDSK